MPRPIARLWCAIFRDTDHPCNEPAAVMIDAIDVDGFYLRLPLCGGHNPETNWWTKRYFELKRWRIDYVTPLPSRG